MRKRIFSRLMAMFMAVALLSTTAFAYVEINQDYINKADVTTEQNRTYIDLKNDDYKLTGDIETSHTLRFKGDGEDPDTKATLDLNGKTIDHGGAVGSVIEVVDGAKLTLEDSSGKENGEYVSAGEGKITGGQAGGVRVYDQSELIMNGGNITGNTSWDGGGIALYGGKFTMNGGNIENNQYHMGGNGAGAIYGQGGSTTKDIAIINGGSIKNNTGKTNGPGAPGAIQVSILEIHGGTISGNKDSDGKFANIWAGNFTMTGGKIIDNMGSIKVYGSTEITGGIICGNGDGDHPEHTFSEATCTEDSVCTYCGKVGAQKATGHTYAPATCTEPETCHCGATRGGALGHDMGEWVVTTPAQPGEAGEETRTCSRCDYTETQPIPALPMPIDFGDSFTGGAGAGTDTTISDEATPLAGIVTEAQLLDALYTHEGSPEVEIVEKYASHEYAPAISWALANAIEVDDEDFDPDEVVTVALLREVLVNFVEYKGVEFTVTVDGADEDLVMDLSERLNVFFAELEK